jgi:hypothetical protein
VDADASTDSGGEGTAPAPLLSAAVGQRGPRGPRVAVQAKPRTAMILEHSIAPRHVAMVKKRVDARVRTLIENGVRLQHRSLFVLVGDKGKDQVVTLHYMLNKAQARGRPSVLWCYKKELGFSRYGVRTLRSLRPGPRPRASYHHMCLSMPVDPCHSTLSVSAPVPPACVHRP